MKGAITLGISLLMLAQPIYSTSAGGEANVRSLVLAATGQQDLPNPLTLVVEVRADRTVLLNREVFGTLDDLTRLTTKLRDLFASRQAQRAYRKGMETRSDLPESERVEKTVLIHIRGTVDQADIDKLIGELKATGANPVSVFSDEEYQKKFGWRDQNESTQFIVPIKGVYRNGMIRAGELNGSATKFTRPSYPEAAKAKHVSGSVKVAIVIDENGKVISASAISGPAVLRESSVAAAWQSEFRPTLHNGKPVKVSGFILYNFVG